MRQRVCLLACLLAFAAPAQTGAETAASSAAPGRAAAISYGGRLYDNHWRELRLAPPSGPHPAYKGANPSVSWRCVSCHGWDYSGSDGQLGQREPQAVPLSHVKGRSPQDIAKFLRSVSHRNIVAALDDPAVEALALFLCCGQHDLADFIGTDAKAKGDPLHGKDIYENTCNRCHQSDGKAPIYGELGDVPSLGWIARQRPAQALHKIRNGVPGADMLSLRFLKPEDIAGLLAYLQTLDPR
jgi:mono/diheme cytochrome c family protein